MATPFNFGTKPASETKAAPPGPTGFGSGASATPAASGFSFGAAAPATATTASAATPAASEFKFGTTNAASPATAAAQATGASATPAASDFKFGASATPAAAPAPATTAAPGVGEFKFGTAAEKPPATTGGKPPMSPVFSMSNTKKKERDTAGPAAGFGQTLGSSEDKSEMHPAEAKFALALSPLLPAAAPSAPGAAGSPSALKLVQGLDEEQTWRRVRSYLRHFHMDRTSTDDDSKQTSSAARLLDAASKPAVLAAQAFVLRERMSSVRVLLKVASVATRHPRHPHFEPCRACVASLVGSDGGASLFTRLVTQVSSLRNVLWFDFLVRQNVPSSLPCLHDFQFLLPANSLFATVFWLSPCVRRVQLVGAISADQDPKAPTFGPPDAVAAVRKAQNIIGSDGSVGQSMALGFSNDVLRVQALQEGLALCASLLLLLDAEDAQPMPPNILDTLLAAVVARKGFEEVHQEGVCHQEELLLKSLQSLSARLCVRALRGLSTASAGDGARVVHNRMEQWMRAPSPLSSSSSSSPAHLEDAALEPVRARLVLAWALECNRPDGLQAACQGRVDGWAFLEPFQASIASTASLLTSQGGESIVSSSSSSSGSASLSSSIGGKVSSLEGQAVGAAAAGVALRLAQQLLLALQADTVEDIVAFGSLASAGLGGQPLASKRIWARRDELLNGGDSELLPQASSSSSYRSEDKEGDSAIVEFLEQQLRKPLASCEDGRCTGLELLGSLVNSPRDAQACQSVLEPALANPTIALEPRSLLAEALAAALGQNNLALPQQYQQHLLTGGNEFATEQALSTPVHTPMSEVVMWQRCSVASHLLLAMVKHTHELSSLNYYRDQQQDFAHRLALHGENDEAQQRQSPGPFNDPAVLLHEAIDQHAHRLTHATFAKAVTDRAMHLIAVTSPSAATSLHSTNAHGGDAAVSGVLSLLTTIIREAPRPWADAVHATIADAPPSPFGSSSGNGTLPPLVSAIDRVCRDVLRGGRPLCLATSALDLGAALVEHGNIEVRDILSDYLCAQY